MIAKLVIAAALILFPSVAYAAPVAVMDRDGIGITLFDEPCKFTHIVNYKYRATWSEDGKTFEGCFGLNTASRVIVAYFDDKSIAVVPMSFFRPVKKA